MKTRDTTCQSPKILNAHRPGHRQPPVKVSLCVPRAITSSTSITRMYRNPAKKYPWPFKFSIHLVVHYPGFQRPLKTGKMGTSRDIKRWVLGQTTNF